MGGDPRSPRGRDEWVLKPQAGSRARGSFERPRRKRLPPSSLGSGELDDNGSLRRVSRGNMFQIGCKRSRRHTTSASPASLGNSRVQHPAWDNVNIYLSHRGETRALTRQEILAIRTVSRDRRVSEPPRRAGLSVAGEAEPASPPCAWGQSRPSLAPRTLGGSSDAGLAAAAASPPGPRSGRAHACPPSPLLPALPSPARQCPWPCGPPRGLRPTQVTAERHRHHRRPKHGSFIRAFRG